MATHSTMPADTHSAREPLSPSSRLSPGAIPEDQHATEGEVSHTGVSTHCAHEEERKWYVLRATYGRTEAANDILASRGITTYLPMHQVTRERDGKPRHFTEPLLPGILFAHMTLTESHEFVRKPAPTAHWIKYYTDRTKPSEGSLGYNPPMTIRDAEMDNFIRLTSTGNEHVMLLPYERYHFRCGDRVRVCQGVFQGVTGRVARVAGQQRVIVELAGLCQVATAYIPTAFMERLDGEAQEASDKTR